MKGSTRDRSEFEDSDRKKLNEGKIQEIKEKYKKKVLKDNDFTDMKLKINLSEKDAHNLIQNLHLDADFLKGYNLTDYSFFVTMHKYSESEENIISKNYRLNKSNDNKIIYNFSIIDFLCVKLNNENFFILFNLLFILLCFY
jgi:hypothetical protein